MSRGKQVAAGVAAVAVIVALTVAAVVVTDRASDEQVDARADARTRNAGRAPGDVDGDGRTDLVVYRPGTATFWVSQTRDGELAVALGQPGDEPTSGDFDGDGRADLVAVRTAPDGGTGTWVIRSSSDGSQRAVSFGLPGDIPEPGDFDGDGRDDIAVFRPAVPGADEEGANAQWFVLRSTDATLAAIPFGIAGDLPAPGDYDGDGITDVAVQRGDTRWIQQSSDGSTVARQFGAVGDVPVITDRDGDDRVDLAVVRREDENQVWYVESVAEDAPDSFPFGRATPPIQQRLVGDFDGDGRTEPAVFDGSIASFWIWTPDEVLAVPWGLDGDVVLPLGVAPTLGLLPAPVPADEGEDAGQDGQGP
jgi:hypothetical protein